jgi:hypothetical protein
MRRTDAHDGVYKARPIGSIPGYEPQYRRPFVGLPAQAHRREMGSQPSVVANQLAINAGRESSNLVICHSPRVNHGSHPCDPCR